MAFLLLLLLLFPCQSPAQQPYVNNKQLNCDLNDTTTLGFVCNAAATSCPSYLTFRSTPTYNTPATIADLLSADASQIASANNVSDVDLLPDDTLVIVPVNCSCSRNYYQHNASYLLKQRGETYFTVANVTYQALTTCQAMEAQNPYNFRELYPGLRLNVPLRCACPTPNQTASGFKYLLTYLIRQGNTYESIASAFSGAGADVQGILAANELNVNQLIFFFTPILVPLKTEPTKENINAVPSPPPSFSPPSLSTIPAAGQNNGSRKWVFIGVGVGAAVLVLFASVLAVWCFCYRHPRLPESPLPPLKLANESGDAGRPFSHWSVSSEGIRSAIETLTVYKFEDVDKATESFAESNRINGSSVYHGSFKGDAAAVKIMKGDVSSEIDVLRQIKHSNILRLSGFCLHQGITYLVYEYAEKGSLSEWLRPTKDSIDSERRLDWKQRVQVAYDVADALNYLHNFTNPPYIHKNLKSSNILLDGNLRAKVGNFGLARILDTDDQTVMTRHVVGTYGYMAPEYIENGLVTPKLDVFAFGVVMLELLSGREPIANTSNEKKGGGDELLSGSIHGVLDGENARENLRVFMDPWLGEEYPLELAYSMAQLARSCVANNLDARPPLSEVFMALSKLLLSCLEWDPSHETSLSLSE
ncbi:protein LYK5 [Sesamum angolense]|uniref:Protein LYK5 n=1 Tax=Sesamum angolense TaxID=2727404 RepID=A0AAE1WAY2_9LAMI|nr:protein LYK5 [Sesamum angolense]